MFLLDKNYYYYVWFFFFTSAHIQIIFSSSSLLDYRFPYCIQLYTWSTQQVIATQHMCWFLKASNLPMFCPTYRTGDPRGFNKGRSSKFREGSRVRQTPEEGRNVVEIMIKMKMIVRKPLMIKITKLHLGNLDNYYWFLVSLFHPSVKPANKYILFLSLFQPNRLDL